MKINHKTNPTLQAKAEIKVNTLLAQLEGKTPAQINNWVENNINTVNDMQNIIKLLLTVVQSLELNK